MKLLRLAGTASLAGFAIALSVGASIGDTPSREDVQLGHHEELAMLIARIDRMLVSTSESLHESASDAESAGAKLALVQQQGRAVLRDIDRIFELECDCPSNCGPSSGGT